MVMVVMFWCNCRLPIPYLMWIYWHGRLAGGLPHTLHLCLHAVCGVHIYMAMQQWVLQTDSWHIAINCLLVQETIWSLAWNNLFKKSWFMKSEKFTHFPMNHVYCCPQDTATWPWQLDSLETCPLRVHYGPQVYTSPQEAIWPIDAILFCWFVWLNISNWKLSVMNVTAWYESDWLDILGCNYIVIIID